MKVFEDIRAAKDLVAQLYRRRNRKPDQQDAAPADEKP
jgi:hypothetical protein